MSGHNQNYKPEKSNPVVWALALLVSTFALLWGFMHFIERGEAVAENIPSTVVAPVASGPAEPDHAALLEAVLADEPAAVAQGSRIYKRACTSCHGADGGAPKLAGARNYLTEEMKNGSGMYDVYRTISQGYGSMAAQLLKPDESYAVAAYIRNTYFSQNPSVDLQPLTPEYIAAGGWPEPNEGGAPVDINVNELKYGQLGVPVAAVMMEKAATEDPEVTALRQRLLKSNDKAVRSLGEQSGNGSLLAALLANVGDDAAFRQVLAQGGLSVVPTEVLIDNARLAGLQALVSAKEVY